jgi:hypothetical protein
MRRKTALEPKLQTEVHNCGPQFLLWFPVRVLIVRGLLGSYGVRTEPEKLPRDSIFIHFDILIKLYDKYT